MKQITILLSAFMITCAATAQITQDSINRLQEELNKKQRDINAMQKDLNRSQRNLNALQQSQPMLPQKPTPAEDQDALIQQIVDDLLAMKIIHNKEELAFSLTADKMEVNNQRQNESVLEKFRAKYHVTKGQAIAHARTRHSSSTSISNSSSTSSSK